MKDIFVIDCYPDTDSKIEKIKSMIDKINSFNKPIAIVSHYKLPNEIIENDKINYIIYDKLNILSDNKTWFSKLWHRNPFFKIEYVNPYLKNHFGSAIYSSIKNVSNMFSSKYDLVHFIESDVVVSFEQYLIQVWDVYLNQYKKFIGNRYYSAATNYHSEVVGVDTRLFAFDPNLMSACLPEINTWEDYTQQCGFSHDLEDMIYYNFNSKFPDLIHLFEDDRYIIHDLVNTVPPVQLAICETSKNTLLLFIVCATSDNEYFYLKYNNIAHDGFMPPHFAQYFECPKEDGIITFENRWGVFTYPIDSTKIYSENVFEFSDNKHICVNN
jgi:hypothetical protein